ncbi:hypothetical protein HOU78_gp45 [Vibrio phage 1.204.O._10N.222.46.F12]|uniref:Uncharacterized protein n=1 Tax=Vibrio phage 1.204.O._10N.222.46.F12 TaxID=1881263 RepID=A0A2I7RNP2_9CAUD|nr:hypothetical protein HOU78_gp45 [Vibrio phage 1.204.O._10N.222.46.F12]AUR95265.1 hypothetical protein NVP1204O_45 [Vibrio phage 1.204.O._10N.222.46.F12]
METTQDNKLKSSSNENRSESLSVLNDTILGKKPFSVVEKGKAPWLFEQVMAHTALLDIRMYFPNELAFTAKRLGHVKYHTKYQALHRERVNQSMSRDEFQRQMGKLFGYSEESIQEFIDSGLYCECHNCGGK